MALSENHWSVNEIMKIGGQDCIKNVEGVIVVSFEFQANGSIQQGRHLSCAENICCNTSVNCVVSSDFSQFSALDFQCYIRILYFHKFSFIFP